MTVQTIQPRPQPEAQETKDPLGFSLDTSSVSLYVLNDQSNGRYRTTDFNYQDYGIIDVLACFQTPELADRWRTDDPEKLKEVRFDEALDLAKQEKVEAVLIIDRMNDVGQPFGTVVFVA
jgi:hypothetical protein